MAIINYSSCFLFLLLPIVLPLFLFSCPEKVEAYRFKEITANVMHQDQTHHVVSLDSLMPATDCSTPAQGSKNVSGLLQLYHKYGPCSPLKQGNAKIPSPRQILINDQTRVKSIHAKFSKKDKVGDSTVKLPANSGVSQGTGNYFVQIGIGKPKQDFILEFDTGSDLTWIQCQPCSQCYAQQDPYFDPYKSSTYSTIPCGSKECSQLSSAGYAAESSCTTSCPYQVTYGDRSYSQGDFATDTLTLSSDVFSTFQFGCGQNNQGLFGSTDGLLGLGRSKISIVSQTDQMYGKIFSYCLPSTTSSSNGFLAFGSEAGSSSTLQYTSLVTNSNRPYFYFLTMTGISVNGQSLSIPDSVFISSGTIIDSGTVITRLAPTAYSALSSAFQEAMSKYPTSSSDSLLDTCYDLSGYSNVELPKIVLHFEGGTDLNVDKSGILYQVSSTQSCLAFAGNNVDTDLGILGNTQQKTFEVVYNVAGEKLGFAAGACT